MPVVRHSELPLCEVRTNSRPCVVRSQRLNLRRSSTRIWGCPSAQHDRAACPTLVLDGIRDRLRPTGRPVPGSSVACRAADQSTGQRADRLADRTAAVAPRPDSRAAVRIIAESLRQTGCCPPVLGTGHSLVVSLVVEFLAPANGMLQT
jgi:hypothetical protein